MKKIIVLITVIMSFCCSFAQQNSNAIYVYRNDGKFNAYFSEEVDSMRYSSLDLDSIEHEDYVVQEIWTRDSIYRIPLSVIDSISVKVPEKKYSNNVVRLDSDYIPYIESVSGLNIVFTKDLPANLHPQIGDILLFESFTDMFPNGFAGRISKKEIADKILFECDSVGLNDIYDNLVIFGDYCIQNKNSDNDSYNFDESRYYLAPRRASWDILPMNLEIPISFGNDAVSLEGIYKANVTVRLVILVRQRETPYVEIGISQSQSLSANLKTEIPYNRRLSGIPALNLNLPIPNMPFVFFTYKAVPFSEFEIKASSEVGFEVSSDEYHAIIFENGKIRKKNNRTSQNGGLSLTSNAGLTGYTWNGVEQQFGISTIGGLLEATIDLSVGPKLEGNVNLNVMSGIEESSWYSALKDSKISLSLRLEGDVALRVNAGPFRRWEFPMFTFIPGFDVEILNRYFLPSFTKPEYKLNNNNVSLLAHVSRDLLLPGLLGLRLVDKDGNIVKEEYDNFPYMLKNIFSGHNPLRMEASDLDYTGSYTVSPLFNILGYTFDATPKTNFNLSATIYTGDASSVTFNSADIWGGYKLSGEDNTQAESVGFCYSSTTLLPTIDNSSVVDGQNEGNNQFKSQLTSLAEQTTYYYRAFIRLKSKLYYGEVRCFTTKKKTDPEEEPDTNTNPNPPDDETPPIAITGDNNNINEHSAIITCSYENIIPETDCGYFLEADTKGSSSLGSQMVSLGCISGSRTISLSGLKSGTTYYYQAYAKNSVGKSLGEEKSFTTKESPIPTAETGDVSDVTENSAIIRCTFGNVPQDGEKSTTGRCGVEVTCSDWSYQFVMAKEDGTYTSKLTNLLPATKYTYCAFADHDGGTVYGEDKTFTTDMPDLSGTWTFTQSYLAEKTVTMNVTLVEQGDGWASYKASGFFGMITFSMTVYANRSASISLNAAQGAHGAFSGKFNDEFTTISGDSYIYAPSDSSWAVAPWTVDDPWVLSR